MLQLSEKTHQQLIDRWRSNSDYVQAYNELEVGFALLETALKARQENGLTQAQVADRMGVPQSTVRRLESALMTGKMSSIPMLRRWAQALGKKLEIRLV